MGDKAPNRFVLVDVNMWWGDRPLKPSIPKLIPRQIGELHSELDLGLGVSCAGREAWATERNTTALAVPHTRRRVNVKGSIWPPSRAALVIILKRNACAAIIAENAPCGGGRTVSSSSSFL